MALKSGGLGVGFLFGAVGEEGGEGLSVSGCFYR